MKKFISRFLSFSLIILLLVSISLLSVSASNSASLSAEPKDGEKVIIYYPESGKVLGNTISNKKVTAVDATIKNGKLSITDDMGIFTLSKNEEKDSFYFIDANGKYLTSGATGNSVSLESAPTDLALWVLEPTEGGYFIKNYAAEYVMGGTSKPQYLEYNQGFTTYSFNSSKATIYTFDFYEIEDAPSTDEPELPLDKPSDVPSDSPSDDSSEPAKPGDASNLAFFAISSLVSMSALFALARREHN